MSLAETPEDGSVCLVMIVKNEEAIVTRCLESVVPAIQTWCIVDTGSTDNTEAIVKTFWETKGVPGTFHNRPWVNFGHNRTEALQLAREHSKAAWLLMMDADDILHTGDSWTDTLAYLAPTAGGLMFRIKRFSITYPRTAVFRSTEPWKYVGSTHEVAINDGGTKPTFQFEVPGWWIDGRTEGARSRDPEKYRNDALLLEKDLAADPSHSRALFYCAQSWRDAGDTARALELYTRYADTADFWNQERFISCLNIVRMTQDNAVAIAYAWKAAQAAPHRAEAAAALLYRLRTQGDKWTHEALAIGLLAMAFSHPAPNDLFSEPDAAAWKLYDEVAIAALYMKANREVFGPAALRALGGAPELQFSRLLTNIRFMTPEVLDWDENTVLLGVLPGQRVWVSPALACDGALFDPCIALVKRWLSKYGCALQDSQDGAAVAIVFRRPPPPEILTIPYILVQTEQPFGLAAPSVEELSNAVAVWCMDVPDAMWVHAHRGKVPRHRIAILPTMFATYYTVATSPVPGGNGTEGSCVHFGAVTARRTAVYDKLRDAGIAVDAKDGTFDTAKLSAAIAKSGTVVCPSYYDTAHVLPLHRIAFVLAHPFARIVVEEAPRSKYVNALLDIAGNRVARVPYDKLVETTTTASKELLKQPENALETAADPIAVFASRLNDWSGETPWIQLYRI